MVHSISDVWYTMGSLDPIVFLYSPKISGDHASVFTHKVQTVIGGAYDRTLDNTGTFTSIGLGSVSTFQQP